MNFQIFVFSICWNWSDWQTNKSFQQHDRSVTSLTLDKYAPNPFICLWQTYSVVQKKTIQFVVNTLYKKNLMIECKNKILNALKNRQRSKEHWPNMLFQSILKEFSFYIIVGYCFWRLFLYVLRFLNIFSIHVPIKKLEFKCNGSLHSIFCRFLQTFVYHKNEHCGGFSIKWNFFIWIVLWINIFSSIYTFIPI